MFIVAFFFNSCTRFIFIKGIYIPDPSAPPPAPHLKPRELPLPPPAFVIPQSVHAVEEDEKKQEESGNNGNIDNRGGNGAGDTVVDGDGAADGGAAAAANNDGSGGANWRKQEIIKTKSVEKKISDELKVFDFDSCPIRGNKRDPKDIGYLTFPFKIGDNLNEFIQRLRMVQDKSPRLWLKACFTICKNLYVHLQKLHALNIFNRDIKPSNIFIENDFVEFFPAAGPPFVMPELGVYFLDFGIGCSGPNNRKNDRYTACTPRSLGETGKFIL